MRRVLWNQGWHFTDPTGALPDAEIDLPHDAMLMEKRVPGLINGSATGYFPGGRYIYTKTLCCDTQPVYYLELGGVYQKSAVYINDECVGGRIYGYSNILLPLTEKVQRGENQVRVEADNTQVPNSRWYSGSGIYRDVWLWMGGEEHILPYGLRLGTKGITPPTLSVSVQAHCGEDVTCEVTVSLSGQTVAQQTLEGQNGQFTAEIPIPGAMLWSAESPILYTVTATLLRGGCVLDTDTARTGLRTLNWNAQRGFLVNGQSVKLRGGCVHHDHGILGAKSFLDAERRRARRRARIMKQAGFNAVRYAHNPASEAFLEACDELGLYVMDETFDTWFGTKSEYDYGLYFDREHRRDVEDMIRVAYNHPSVVMYCIGNEIPLRGEESAILTRELVGICHRQDPSRPVLNAVNALLSTFSTKRADAHKATETVDPRRESKAKGATGSLLFNMASTHFSRIVKLLVNEKKMRKLNDVLEPLDLVGFNYGDFLYEPQHRDYPERVLLGSETYPREIASYWDKVRKYPYVIGDFTWTAWDYLGEAGVGAACYGAPAAFTRPYPCISGGCSNIDLIGDIRAQGAYFLRVYGLEPRPYLAVHPVNHSGEKIAFGSWALTDAIHSWSWRGCEGKMATVDVYADAYAVELRLNGQTLGRKRIHDYTASFTLPYAPGTLQAVGYDDTGEQIGEDVLCTAEPEIHLAVRPETPVLRADRQSLSYVALRLCDAKGVVEANSDQVLQVQVTGPAELIGLGSANPFTEDNYLGHSCHTWYGSALAIVRATGEEGEITIQARTRTGLRGCATLIAKKGAYHVT